MSYVPADDLTDPAPFSAYLGYIGYDIVIDRENGVIMLQNCRDLGENGKLQINHVTLKKMESVVLCCLWTLYADFLFHMTDRHVFM